MDAAKPEDKEQQLHADRRLLGRLLGEVIREQAGADMLARIEQIRQTAVGFRRAEAQPEDASGAAEVKGELEGQLDALDIEQTLHVVRAFSYFSHLLNIAEDAHQHRRRRAHAAAASPHRPGSLPVALERVQAAGVDGAQILKWLARARISPVLTAHPTEVKRQSVIGCEREIARLVDLPEDAARNSALHREVLRLWLTSMLRIARLAVADEITNGLAFFNATFLEEVPRLYDELETLLAARFQMPETPRLRSSPWAPGSVAIVTAIRTSTPACWNTRSPRRRR
ncbi:MAG: phosphoenolpyruvate carboxylase [Proteobacteria bacterium]|nr:phosphoenolpyruvate carboxylase [Pseudomonadota bacterium]